MAQWSEGCLYFHDISNASSIMSNMVVMGMGHPGGPPQELKTDGDNKSQVISAIALSLLAWQDIF